MREGAALNTPSSEGWTDGADGCRKGCVPPLLFFQVQGDASHGRDGHGDGPFGPMRLEGLVPRSQSGQGQDVALLGRVV